MKNILLNIKKSFSLILCGAMLLCAVGCDNKTGSSDVQSEIIVSAEETSEPSFPVNCCGVRLEKSVEKAVCLSPAAAEIVFELGFWETIVGVSVYCDYPEGLAAKKVGSAENPDIDAIIALKPDAVFTLSPLSERDIYALNEANIPVLEADPPVNMEGYSALYREIATAFYGREKAEGEKGDTKAVQIAAATRSELEKAAKTVSLESFVYVTEKLTIAGSGTFEGAVLSLSGKNICEESGYVGTENLPEEAPKFIIASDALTTETLYNNTELYSYISSGAEIKFVSSAYFERPSARTSKIFEQINSDSE